MFFTLESTHLQRIQSFILNVCDLFLFSFKRVPYISQIYETLLKFTLGRIFSCKLELFFFYFFTGFEEISKEVLRQRHIHLLQGT